MIRYRRERWRLPLGETVLAGLPAGIVGGFGPELRRFVLALHAQGQVTTERLTALLNGIGVELSKRQVVRMLTGPPDDFVAEDREALRAGLATARGFTVFRTGASKSREAFLPVLRAGHTDDAVNAAALDFMRGHGLSGQGAAQLDAHPAKRFADTSAWSAHLARLGIGPPEVTPDPVQVASEGALWGAIRHHGLLAEAVVVSDGAGRFRVGTHALCGAHAARLHRRKSELLRVLEHPEIPLHTNGSENDIRACVTQRTISGGTVSTAGRAARDVTLGLMKTCRKLGVPFFRHLGDRLHVPGAISIPPLSNLVRQAATTV